MVAETAAPVDGSRSPGPGIGIPAAIGAVATGDFDAAGLTAGNGAPVDERAGAMVRLAKEAYMTPRASA